MKASLCDNEEQKFIENIPELKWNEGRDTSFIGSVQLTLDSLGDPYEYEYLMGISGAAFRFHFQPDWCPSAGDQTTGFNVSGGLFKSLGYSYEAVVIDDGSFDDIRSLYQRVIQQINKGIPVIAINLKVCPEWGIITGYLKKRPGLLCRTYFDDSGDYSLAEHTPWITYFLGEKGEAQDEDLLFRNALQLAVKLGKTEKFEEYLSDVNAFRQWIEELRKHARLLDKGVFEHHEVNLTLFNVLLDTRRAALKFLISGNTAEKLTNGHKIIEALEKENGILSDAQLNILPSFESEPGVWTRRMLQKEADILEQVSEIEAIWINLIEAAL
jgi:hypothetical protein